MRTNRDGLRLWQYVGPWPLRPWVGFWGAGSVNLIATLAINREAVTTRPFIEIPRYMLPVALGAGAFALYLLIVARPLPSRTPRRLPSYLALIFGGAVVDAVIMAIVSRAFDLPAIDEARYLVFQSLRMWVWTVFLLAVAGVTVRRLSRQTEIAERALAVSLEQQSMMLVNEERSRRQIALLLHDRVQAGLMTACLELRLAIAPDDEVDRARIDKVISRLDDIRGMDVRLAARTLSPDLVTVDLRTALQELTRIYEPGMRTVIEISPGVTGADASIPPDALLACYRILEQGLLNAAVHAGATACSLAIGLTGDGELALSLEDNGRGLPAAGITPGFGSTIIDSWCRVFAGSWELVTAHGGGARLTVRLALESESTPGQARPSHADGRGTS